MWGILERRAEPSEVRVKYGRCNAKFKNLVIAAFKVPFKTSLHTMKFHLLNYLVDDVRRYGAVMLPGSLLYDLLNMGTKSTYRDTSKRHCSGLEKTVLVVERRETTEGCIWYDVVQNRPSCSLDKHDSLRLCLVGKGRMMKIDWLRLILNRSQTEWSKAKFS